MPTRHEVLVSKNKRVIVCLPQKTSVNEPLLGLKSQMKNPERRHVPVCRQMPGNMPNIFFIKKLIFFAIFDGLTMTLSPGVMSSSYSLINASKNFDKVLFGGTSHNDGNNPSFKKKKGSSLRKKRHYVINHKIEMQAAIHNLVEAWENYIGDDYNISNPSPKLSRLCVYASSYERLIIICDESD